MTPSSNLRQHRAVARMSRRRLSELSGVSRRTIQNIENGHMPKKQTMSLIQNVLTGYSRYAAYRTNHPRCAGQGCDRADSCETHKRAGNGWLDNYKSEGCKRFVALRVV